MARGFRDVIGDQALPSGNARRRVRFYEEGVLYITLLPPTPWSRTPYPCEVER
ncbi:hypothetical protein SUDANB96_00528 [Streptomyces sp. enrichment culture]